MKLNAQGMMLAEECLEEWNLKYEIWLVHKKEAAQIAKYELLKNDWEAILKVMIEKMTPLSSFYVKPVEHAQMALKYKIYETYDKLLLFSDAEIKNGFKKLKLKEFNTRWLVNIDDIEREFKLIEEKGIKINKLWALQNIDWYLNTKLQNQMLTEAAPAAHDNIIMSKLSKILINLEKKINYDGNNRPFKEPVEHVMNEIVSDGYFTELFAHVDKRDEISRLKDIFRGKTEHYLITQTIEDYFYYPTQLTKTKFFCAIYDLMSLILETNLIDENTFTELKDVSYKSWDFYRYKRLNNIFYPRKKKENLSSD